MRFGSPRQKSLSAAPYKQARRPQFRVTAAVALHNAGVPIDVITVRLRWNSDAVKVYLRDSEHLARTLSFKAMHGAFAA